MTIKMTNKRIRKLSHWQLLYYLERVSPPPCIGKHYSEVTKQLIAMYGECVAEQLDLIELSNECGYVDTYYIELYDDKNFWKYRPHWQIKIDKNGFITEQEIIEYVPSDLF